MPERASRISVTTWPCFTWVDRIWERVFACSPRGTQLRTSLSAWNEATTLSIATSSLGQLR